MRDVRVGLFWRGEEGKEEERRGVFYYFFSCLDGRGKLGLRMLGRVWEEEGREGVMTKCA